MICNKIFKYKIYISVLLILLSVFYVPSPYHVNYYAEPSYFIYFKINFFILFINIYFTNKLILVEKILYAALISCIVLIVVGYLLEKFLGYTYGYDTNWDELKSPELLDNALFFLISNFIGMGFIAFWLKYKKPIY
ncbi:hypothetical protein B0A77_03595 [Flavobacterium branchiophilum]|uniref:Uncharacterized protein n=1 Tax=Flavobacterium branchiophilum TaxID=55197 RepID=A0A2H3KPH5_9FLAO|nr:hypothetical protein B0A77_03595 [Flavobacterium branchiophilum]